MKAKRYTTGATDDPLATGGMKKRRATAASKRADGDKVRAKGLRAILPLPEERAQVLLERVVTIYAQAFAESTEGRDFLASRGLADLGLLERHRVGYADGRLANLLPTGGAVRAELRTLGVLVDNPGHELLAACVVFPVFDDAGSIVTLCGYPARPVDSAQAARTADIQVEPHVYLPNRARGLWNVAALKSSPHVILVKSIFDALSVEAAGMSNVVAMPGSEGLSDGDAATFCAQGTQRVTLLLDPNGAGRAVTQQLKARVTGLTVDTIQLPEGQEPNGFLMRHGAAVLGALLAPSAATVERSDKGSASAGEAPSPESGMVSLALSLRRYNAFGLEKTARALKATVRVERAGRLHVDTLDLFSARARRQLALDLVRVFEESADTIEADLTKLLTACEARAEQSTPSETGAVTVVMSDAERRAGEDLGRDPGLIETILADYERCGLVGERANKLLFYLAMTSRKMPRPLAVLNLASSGAGKTALQDTALAFCPPEDLVKLTSLSGKALFYKERDSLKHKILALEEGDGVGEAMYALRNLISAGELVTESTIKNPVTGRLVTMTNKVEGPAAVFLTTTNPETDAETKSRFFVTSVDESRTQTEAILKLQRRRHTLAGFSDETAIESVLRRHRAFQRVLEPVHIVNPYAEQLRYGDGRLPGRRDQPKYLTLIDAIAFLRQLQKPRQTHTGRRYVEVDLDDIGLANDLATELLGHSLAELSRPASELLLLIERLRTEWTKAAGHLAYDGAKSPGPSVDGFSFSRRQLREFAGWAHHRVHRYLAELIELEYVSTDGVRRGCLQCHGLLWDGQGKDGGRFLLGLKSPGQLQPTPPPAMVSASPVPSQPGRSTVAALSHSRKHHATQSERVYLQ
jgi:hypothetical protein